jgi:hypothetical protein
MALLAESASPPAPVAAVPLNQQVRLIVKCPGLDPAFCLPGTVRRITVALPNTSTVGSALQSGVSNTVRRLDSPIVLQARLPVEANSAQVPTQRAYVS